MKIKRIETTSHFDRSFSKLPLDIQKKVAKKKVIFKNDPFEVKLRTHKLKGRLKNLWSFSITRSHRIVFKFLNNDQVIFYDIGDHRIYQ